MKLKYYMRGLGVGILITTIILSLASKKEKLSDTDIMTKARELGMVMKEEDINDNLQKVLEKSFDKEKPEHIVADNNQSLEEAYGNNAPVDKTKDLTDTDDSYMSLSGDEESGYDSGNTDVPELHDEDGDLDNGEIKDSEEIGDTEGRSDIDSGEFVDSYDGSDDNGEVADSDDGNDIDNRGITDSDGDNHIDNLAGRESDEEDMITFTIVRGMSSGQIADLLIQKGLIDDAVDFDNYIKQKGKAEVLRVGTYMLSKDSDYHEILRAIIK